jgi:hypothetical protein
VQDELIDSEIGHEENDEDGCLDNDDEEFVDEEY